ncbi:MAG: hypothetical protein MK132_07435 [Lentisphaerales bacterium]|nr:hypothetical protein [Lentisphaerales bacterium]
MRKKNSRIPDHLKTTGDWNRFRLADLMVRGALLDPSLSETEQTAGQALCWIVFGDKNYKTACLAAITLGYPGIMTMLKDAKLPLD